MDAGHMGPDITFATDYRAAFPDTNLVFVPEATGSTGFAANNWNPGDTEYDAAVAATNAALAAIPNVRLVGIVWLQGENDALSITSTTEASYAADVDAMFAAMRAGITGATNTPIVVGQIPFIGGAFFDKQIVVRAAIEDTPNRIARCAFADNTSLTKLGDGLHYDAASLRIMGNRLFTALRSLI
jgi:hypothetical protein